MLHLYVIFILLTTGYSYKPIIALHGFSITPSVGTFHDWDNITQWVQQEHPGQLFIALNIFNGLDSTRPLWEQATGISSLISQIVASNDSFRDGYHFLGHSQGGLMMRVMLEVMDNLQVDTYVSLAGVQYGIYGVGFISNYFQNVSDEYITDLFYTTLLQDQFSAANFWHSPETSQNYLTNNLFLPVVNNENPGPNAALYKSNFLKAKRYVFFGSPDDGTVIPWETEIWGFYDNNEIIISMQNQKIFTQDTFGLQTAYNDGRLILHTVPGIQHSQWLHNESNFKSNVLPYLD